ncbi:DUF4136 domain-containing protein [Hydrogenimonas sp.]
MGIARALSGFFAVLFLSAFVAGCAAKGPVVDYDPAFDFSKLETFGVMAAEGSRIDPLDSQRIEEAIAADLAAKGYRHDDPADFVVRYKMEVAEDVPSNISFGFGLGSYSWDHGGGGVSVGVTPSSDEVVLTIFMTDPQSGRVFWSASEETELPSLPTPQSRTAFFGSLVAKALHDFPPAGGGSNE